MIDVNDLMTGNFVKHDNDIVDVYKIYSCGIGDDCGDYYYDDEIEGIEVTKEILEKIGFKKDTTAGEPWEFWRYWDKDGRYKLDVYPEELYCNSNRTFGLHVDNASCASIGSGEFTYVHELMNLVRVITGHELKIEMEVFNE